MLLATGLLSGCLGTDRSAPSQGALGREGDQAAPSARDEARMRARLQELLDERARAVRDGDLARYLSRVDPRDPELLAREERYFRNVVQLPWARFDYEVLDSAWQVRTRPRWGRDLLVPEVRQRTRLEGFDEHDVVRTVGWVVSFDGRRPLLVSDRGAGGRRLLGDAPAPWDLTAVTVRQRPGVLGVFDEDTVASASEVMRLAQRGIEELEPLPFAWPRAAVVYSLGRSEVLDSFTDVPGGSIDLLGAITFPVHAEPGGADVASTRLLVLPSSVAAGEPFLGRILRHELSHVAVGPRDDGAPTWFSEGLAEYLGARPVPREQRSIPTSALQRSREQPPAGMPASTSFNGPQQDWHYALSWMACDHVAASAGEQTLWRLLEAFESADLGDPDAGQDEVLREVLGYDSAELAERAVARIRELYG